MSVLQGDNDLTPGPGRWLGIAVRASLDAVARETAFGISSAWVPEAQTMLLEERSGWTWVLAADGDTDFDLTRSLSAQLDTLAFSLWSCEQTRRHGLLVFEEGDELLELRAEGEESEVAGELLEEADLRAMGARAAITELLGRFGVLRPDWTWRQARTGWEEGAAPEGVVALQRLED